ncbi:MAG TPA: HEAT repeat domain-containing protein [Terriglobia bacterium]|nr:HEAT repeat domain-containing protein [Terriglobia bacterium]
MPFLIEHISEAVLAMNVLVFLAACLLIVTAFLRRRGRTKYFHRIDALRRQYGPTISGVLDGKVEFGKGLGILAAMAGSDRVQVLELLLLEQKIDPSQLPIMRQLCQDLGLVDIWQEQLEASGGGKKSGESRATPNRIRGISGRFGYMIRASGANNLGIIRHQPSWPLLVRALGDVHPDVASVAARSLAAIGEPESFKPLLDCLYNVVLNTSSQVSLRSIKMALVSFPLEQATLLVPSLRHLHRRIRFLAVDMIREMVERRAAVNDEFVLAPPTFTPELSELFLTRLNDDENPDVRARAAPVIAYLADPRAAYALQTLLGDKEWFVRLHAARAFAKRKYESRAYFIASRLCDPQWMVREASAQTLLSFGRQGLSQLYDYALTTTDRYSKEQIADEIQRAGLIPELLAQYELDGKGKEFELLEQLADLGITSYILEAVEGSCGRNLRTRFLADFGRHPDLQIRTWVRGLASGNPISKLRHRATVARATAPQAERA